PVAMGNSNSACKRCLRGEADCPGNDGAFDFGSRLVVAVDDVSDSAATPGSEAAPVNGSAAGEAVGSTESESLVPSSGARLLAHAAFPFTAEEASLAWLRANRVLFLMRGLPGSGKSTLTRLLCQLYPGSTVCSADLFFIDPASGAFQFDADRLKDAHEACNNRAYEAMSCGKSPVIVDNTNVRRWEFQFYVDLATRFGYVLLLVVPKTPWRFDAQQLANRTLHSVPLEIIEQRLSSWEAAHPTYYAWFLQSADAARLFRLARDFLDCLASSSTGAPEPLPQLPAGVATAEPPVPASSGRRSKSRKQRSASPPQSPAPPLLHATAKFCGRRGASQQELVSQIDYHNRPDVQAALGRVFHTAVSAICVTTRTVSFKMDLSEQQLALWDHDVSENEAPPGSPRLPAGSRAHVTIATAPRVPAKQAGLDLLAALQQASQEPEPGPDELVLMTEWGFARGCGPDTCLLTLDEPIALDTIFASAY
ncbi:hypothetical protein BOX15_Mlig005619g1, partial [Macrostomum lignano]